MHVHYFRKPLFYRSEHCAEVGSLKFFPVIVKAANGICMELFAGLAVLLN
jgi:hypothetical protein